MKSSGVLLPRPFRHPHRDSGYTLLELLIAVVIGLILLATVGYVFLTGRTTQRQLTEVGRMQEAARFTLERMGREIRQAGYVGFTTLGYIEANNMRKAKPMEDPAPNPAYGPVRLNPYLTLRVFDATDAPQWTVGLPNNATRPTSALISSTTFPRVPGPFPVVEVRHATEGSQMIAERPVKDGFVVKTIGPATGNFEVDDVAVISSGSQTDGASQMVRIAAVAGNVITLHANSPIRNDFIADSQIARLKVVRYFLGSSSSNPSGLSQPTLMAQEMHRNGMGMLSSQPMQDHVEQFNVVLGLTSRDADGLRTGYATSTVDWKNSAAKTFPPVDASLDGSILVTKDTTTRPSIASVELQFQLESQKDRVTTNFGRLQSDFSTVVSRRNRHTQ